MQKCLSLSGQICLLTPPDFDFLALQGLRMNGQSTTTRWNDFFFLHDADSLVPSCTASAMDLDAQQQVHGPGHRILREKQWKPF